MTIDKEKYSTDYWASLSIYISNYIYHNYDKFINESNNKIINKNNNLFKILKNQQPSVNDKYILSNIFALSIVSKIMA